MKVIPRAIPQPAGLHGARVLVEVVPAIPVGPTRSEMAIFHKVPGRTVGNPAIVARFTVQIRHPIGHRRAPPDNPSPIIVFVQLFKKRNTFFGIGHEVINIAWPRFAVFAHERQPRIIERGYSPKGLIHRLRGRNFAFIESDRPQTAIAGGGINTTKQNAFNRRGQILGTASIHSRNEFRVSTYELSIKSTGSGIGFIRIERPVTIPNRPKRHNSRIGPHIKIT